MSNIWHRLRDTVSRQRRGFKRINRDEHVDQLIAHASAYQAEVQQLRGEIDELRQDSLRIAELYDLVFERLRKGEI